IDAYRLQGPDDLAGIGWGEELREQAVVAVEWADLVLPGLGEDRLEVRVEHVTGGRQLTFWPGGAWVPRIDFLRARLRDAGLSDHWPRHG
ncbi:MAG: tRNA (adenosine(37)-N6)-threonylcarbamoyltransferase complex ATPase subunit type 1 TsaE, partial [Phycisphaeraceae bacterium]